jgi:aspartyl-tRNA(Asn)/glutamyl-tRNA(Gln) amidotransferase subunit B
VEYFVAVAERIGDGRRAGNWVQQEVLRAIKELHLSISEFPISSAALADLLTRVEKNELTSSRAKDVFQRMLETAADVPSAMQALGITAVAQDEMLQLCEQLLADNPGIVADVRAGKQQAIGALVGQAKKRNPNANPAEIKRICLELISKM